MGLTAKLLLSCTRPCRPPPPCFPLYVLWLGFGRFKTAHLKQPGAFNWKRHVLWGEIVLCAWLAGMLGGLYMVWSTWPMVFITGRHAWVGLSMAPLILFGLVSGLIMHRRKKRRKTLP